MPLEDVWAIQLRGGGAGRTIQDLRAVLITGVEAAPLMIVKGLFRLRRRIGTLFGWDEERPAWNANSYVYCLSEDDRAKSTAAPGTRDGRFRLLYRFENEQLSELRNATVHAFNEKDFKGTELAFTPGQRVPKLSKLDMSNTIESMNITCGG